MRRAKVITNTKSYQTEKPFENGFMKQSNGLSDALGCGGFNSGGGWMGTLGGPDGGLPGYPAGAGSPQQLSDTTTLFTNLRWYVVSNFRQLLTELYVEIGLIKTIVDVPVDDGLRGGVTIKSKQLSEEQIGDLKIAMDRDDDLGVMGWGAKWNRLFGGGGILIIVGDQDPETPLDLASIKPDTEVIFRAVDMWELFWDQQNVEGYEPEAETEDFEFYDYYASRVHKSRIMRLKGMEAPSFIRPRFRGWGVSVVENLVRSINQYLKAADLTFEVLDEFKIDVYKVKNLVNTLLNPNGTQQIQKRIQLANWQKNYQHAVVMDSEDDWDHKQLSFAGLAEAQAGIRKQVAADMRMPITKLFGSSDSSNAMGTADQNDMENYNSMVESEVRNKLKYDILRLIEIRCQRMFGFIPDDIEIEFSPLRVLTAEQEENVKTQKWNRVFQAKQAGEITTIEFRDTCNKGNLFDVKLDTSTAAISEVESIKSDMLSAEVGSTGGEDDSAAEGDHSPEEGTDTGDPGANREDSRDPENPKPLAEYGAPGKPGGKGTDDSETRPSKDGSGGSNKVRSKESMTNSIRCWKAGDK